MGDFASNRLNPLQKTQRTSALRQAPSKGQKPGKITKKVHLLPNLPLLPINLFHHCYNKWLTFSREQFIINASQPASDKIFDVSAFEKFLHDKIKVDNRTGNLGDTVTISQQGEGKIEVIAHTQFSGRYLKYLTKKFLKKQQLRDWLRVVSTSQGVYELRFFNVVNDDADDDDE